MRNICLSDQKIYHFFISKGKKLFLQTTVSHSVTFWNTMNYGAPTVSDLPRYKFSTVFLTFPTSVFLAFLVFFAFLALTFLSFLTPILSMSDTFNFCFFFQ